MKVSKSKLKNAKVYFCGESEPFGVFSDTILDESGRVAGYMVKTLSIVPISKIIRIGDIEKIVDGRVYLSKSATLENSEHFKTRTGGKFVYADNIKTAAVGLDKASRKLKDIRFDFETGEICDVVIVKNIITGKEKLSVNKISAKDNTIYIQN